MVAFLKNTLRMPAETDERGSERRIFPRKESRAQVDGRRVDHSVTARRFPHLNLALRDISMGGFSALSQQPLDCGEHLAVSFPAAGDGQQWAAFGRVLRCQPSSVGYRIAVEFDPLPAA
ncbi:MAG: PilZ domain-containing protein [Phycisphaerales bacterium]|nr:PilZ domain-containing protein [Phycisphaerales bacterium]